MNPSILLQRIPFLLLPTLVLLFSLSVSHASDDAGIAFLEENAKKPGVVVLPSGLQYKALRTGMGLYHPKSETICKVHYYAKHINGTVFDSSHQRLRQFEFQLNHVLKGWLEALQMMVEGDRWELYIPSELAYGADGARKKTVRPHEVLIYDVELMEIVHDDDPSNVVEAEERCDVVTRQGCNEQISEYIRKSLLRYKTVERMKITWTKLERAFHSEAIETLEHENWTHIKMQVLQQLMHHMETGEIRTDVTRDEL